MIFYKSLKIILNIDKIKRLIGSSYIPTPKFLKDIIAHINLMNDDQKCLLWCVAISEILKTNPNLRNPGRITKILKKKAESFNIKGINFRCGFSDIDKFEKNNISINVFGYNEEERFGNKKHEIFPLRVSKLNEEHVNTHVDTHVDTHVNTHVNILLISDENGDKHYCLIKNMSRLFSNQVNKSKEKIHICNYCLQNFRNEKTLKNHLEYCSKYKCGKTVYPNKGEKLKFKNYERMHNVPFVIYADFECILKNEDSGAEGKNIGDNTKQFQNHEPSGYCYLMKCFDDNLFRAKLVKYTKKY